MLTSARIQARTLAVLFALLVLLGMHVPPARAAGPLPACTQAAIQNAVNQGGEWSFACSPATLTIPFSSTVTVPAGAAATLDGGGTITLDGQGLTRLFLLPAGASLTLKNITLINGSIVDDGGAIYNAGSLALDRVTITGSKTDASHSGGAIVTYGPLSIRNSTLSGNQGGNAGALYPRWGAAVVVIENSTLSDNSTTNTTSGWGGAILAWDGAEVTITGSKLERNTAVDGGAIYATQNSTVTLQANTQVLNNTASSDGGGLYNAGFMSLDATNMSGNTAGNYGGGAYLYGEIPFPLNAPASPARYNAVMNIRGGSRLAANQAALGGGIFSEGVLTVEASTILGNSANYGGGIRYTWNTTLNKVTVAENTATLYDGGGAAGGPSSSLKATDTTFRDNSAAAIGGAIINGGNLELYRVTLSGNYAMRGGGAYLHSRSTWTNVTLSDNRAGDKGGGLFLDPGQPADWTNLTFFANSAAQGGAVYTGGQGGNIVMQNTILAGSLNSANCDTPIPSLGGNLSSDASCGLAAAYDQQNLDPLLGSLADNGGPTLTHLPGPGSPTIDGGRGTYCPLQDQRGIARPKGFFCDIGAVEVDPEPVRWKLFLSLVEVGAPAGLSSPALTTMAP